MYGIRPALRHKPAKIAHDHAVCDRKCERRSSKKINYYYLFAKRIYKRGEKW